MYLINVSVMQFKIGNGQKHNMVTESNLFTKNYIFITILWCWLSQKL